MTSSPQVCPTCGCAIAQSSYNKEGIVYCCEPCATGSSQCGCGCCHPVSEENKKAS